MNYLQKMSQILRVSPSIFQDKLFGRMNIKLGATSAYNEVKKKTFQITEWRLQNSQDPTS